MDDDASEDKVIVIRFLNNLKRQVDREESYSFQNALYKYRLKDRLDDTLDDVEDMLKDQLPKTTPY